MFHRMIAAIAVTTALAAPAWAGRNQADQFPSAQPEQRVAQANEACADAQSPAAQRQRQEVQGLLNRLEAGQNVSPAEVERVLRQSVNP